MNAEVPLLGNRVDRYVWDGSRLTFDQNVIMLRAAQPAVPAVPGPAQNAAGNHDGGVIRVGNDGKLYILIGDTGRRGWTQNLRCGPAKFYTCPPGTPVMDDIFGGPMPDDAHLTGVILRLNADGTAPRWNPFYDHGAEVGGEVGANIQSPASRVAQFKTIETTPGPTNDPFAPNGYVGLQQNRWPPSNLADTPAEAMSRLQMFPGAHYSDPELSWVYEVGPAAIGFLEGKGLGNEYSRARACSSGGTSGSSPRS